MEVQIIFLVYIGVVVITVNSEIKENFRNLFNSYTKYNPQKTIEIQNRLRKEAVKEQHAFNLVAHELLSAKQQNMLHRNQNSESRAFKRMANKVTSIDLQSRPKQFGDQCLHNAPDFKLLIEDECYVDKTSYIDKLMKLIRRKFFFLSRPRRFGKTLLIDMMEEYFSGTQNLFRNTEIYQRHPGVWKHYPTIRFDFSEGISSDSAWAFNRTLLKRLKTEATKMDICIDGEDIEVAIGELISLSSKKFNSPIVILVDEYDSPYTRSYAKNKDEAFQILATLQSFYSTLKGEYKNIHFCFVTGITRIALSDFFSGFNEAFDLTMNSEYAGIVGFNETELHAYFGHLIKHVASEMGKKEEEILEQMRTWHDGFQFSEKFETLYSPCSIFGYLSTKTVSTTSWSETGGPSKFLVQKLKEFPTEALQFFVDQRANHRVNNIERRLPSIYANRMDLTGKIDFGEHDVKELVALLFHNGYLSIRNYNPNGDIFTLKFTNLELEEDYALRLSSSLRQELGIGFIKKINLMVKDLIAYQWDKFIKDLNACNGAIPYQITMNQHEAKEAWFHFSLFLMLSHAVSIYRTLVLEDSTSMGRADLVFANDLASFIFEPKMEDNPENPVFECKEKYLQKYLFDSERKVFCIGLKFTTEGRIHSWGIASFSYSGQLVGEDGTVTLTNQLSSKEREEICDKITYSMIDNPKYTLEPETLINFLEGVGPTTEGQLIFAKKFSKNIGTLCDILEEIKEVFESGSNIRGIIFSFLKAAKPPRENQAIEKPVNSDSDALLYLSRVLAPVQALFADKSNTFPISFADFVRFIHQCDEPKEASSIASRYTEDIPNLLILLDESYPLVKDTFLKSRITRIRTALKKN